MGAERRDVVNRPKDFWDRKAEIEREAKAVMKELRRQGGDWETAWMNHPLAKEYRELMKSAWASKSLLEEAPRNRCR